MCQTLNICGEHNRLNKSPVGVGWRVVVSVTILVAVTVLVKIPEGVTEARRGGKKWKDDYRSKVYYIHLHAWP